MKGNTATLADVKLVPSAPIRIQTKRGGYGKAQVDFASARMKFIDRATSTTWTRAVEAARRLHAEAKRVSLARGEREREAAASRPPLMREGKRDASTRALREVGNA